MTPFSRRSGRCRASHRLLTFTFALGLILSAAAQSANSALWNLAREQSNAHRFSTLFTAQDVRDQLSSDAGIHRAIEWCKATGITRVYVESFRDGYRAEAGALSGAARSFREAGFMVSGCVTPTGVGKPSSGWKTVSCYTDAASQAQIKSIFEFTAGLFDEIMIDDFWFTDCTCAECEAARKSKTVQIGERTFPVRLDTWEEYRRVLMLELSRTCVIEAAKKVNPKAQLIIKYPQWYDRFHERGYDVLQETELFDKIWVGTETRDYRNPRWGGTVPYEAFFIMRWLGDLGGNKCGGGWYDWLGTTERTYVEQARQTVLGGARESMLFCYGGLQGTTGPKDVEALRQHIPELLQVAREVRSRPLIGIAAYKPGNSHPETEARVFDFVGMLGFPLVPCHEFPTNAPAAFFSVHALKDPGLAGKLSEFIKAGRPVLLTDGLMERLKGRMDLSATNVLQLPVRGDPKSLLALSEERWEPLRTAMLRPFHTAFEAPAQVGLYLFRDGSFVAENFLDEAARVQLNGKVYTISPRGWTYVFRQ